MAHSHIERHNIKITKGRPGRVGSVVEVATTQEGLYELGSASGSHAVVWSRDDAGWFNNVDEEGQDP